MGRSRFLVALSVPRAGERRKLTTTFVSREKIVFVTTAGTLIRIGISITVSTTATAVIITIWNTLMTVFCDRLLVESR